MPPGIVADKSAMEAALEGVRIAAKAVLDFALPPRCPGCGAVTEDAHRFCVECWKTLTFLGDPSCARCGLPFDYDVGAGVECGACLANPPAFDRLRAAVAYGDIPRKVVLKLKYGRRPGVARTLARFMERHLAEVAADSIVLPVPLHRWRIWKRGYNQSALIASALASRAGLAVELDLLRRVKATPVLRGMNGRERASAVRGAFEVSEAGKKITAGRSLVLVDDVCTSGATASACAKALKRAGAARVNIICWARVLASED